MSPREEAQQRIEEYLSSDRRRWSAPYGVIGSLTNLPRGGKVRTITFGVARFLDAEVLIWSPTRIEVRGEGPLAVKVEGTFASADEVIDYLRDAW